MGRVLVNAIQRTTLVRPDMADLLTRSTSQLGSSERCMTSRSVEGIVDSKVRIFIAIHRHSQGAIAHEDVGVGCLSGCRRCLLLLLHVLLQSTQLFLETSLFLADPLFSFFFLRCDLLGDALRGCCRGDGRVLLVLQQSLHEHWVLDDLDLGVLLVINVGDRRSLDPLDWSLVL